MDVNLFENVIGEKEKYEVSGINTNEALMITSGTGRTVGLVTSGRTKEIEIKLKTPICAEIGDKVALFRQIGGRWRLIGYGIIKSL